MHASTQPTNGPRPIRVLVVGGLDRLAHLYSERADAVVVDTIPRDVPTLQERLGAADGVVVVVSMISHPAAQKVRKVTKTRGTPVMHAGGPGLGQVRRTIDALVTKLSAA